MNCSVSMILRGRWISLFSVAAAVLVLLFLFPFTSAQVDERSLFTAPVVDSVSKDSGLQTALPHKLVRSSVTAGIEGPPRSVAEGNLPINGGESARRRMGPWPERPATQKPTAEELTNESCLDCHKPDILKMSKEELADMVVTKEPGPPPRAKPPYEFAKLSLSIDEKRYTASVHGDITCVTCHKDIVELPHEKGLKRVDCGECHEESVAAVQASAHGKQEATKPKPPDCVGCHDVHYQKGQNTYAKEWHKTLCVVCHKAYGQDIMAIHRKLYEPNLHTTTLQCMMCHQGQEPGVHGIPLVKTSVASCQSCHSRKSILSKEKAATVAFAVYVRKPNFINRDVLTKFGYLVGANRIPALDTLVILAVLGPLALPIFHGGMRFLTRRKGPIELPTEKILLHPLIERLWHWFQALCIIMLIITGIMLHWPEKFPGWFDWTVTTHNWFGISLLVSYIVWLVYNLTTGRIRHYIPRKGEIPAGMIRQARFYAYGIFKHEPHPYAPTEDNKFNPLQKITYLQKQMVLYPLLLISGILYMYPETFRGIINAVGGMTVLGIFHYLLGAIFAAFLMAHLYLATTGETIGENFKAIIFGYGIKSHHTEYEETHRDTQKT